MKEKLKTLKDLLKTLDPWQKKCIEIKGNWSLRCGRQPIKKYAKGHKEI